MTLFGDRKFRPRWCYLWAKPQAYHLSEEILWLVMNVLYSLLENWHQRGNIAQAFEAASCQLISVSLAGRIPPIRRVRRTFPSVPMLRCPIEQCSCRFRLVQWWCWDPLAALRPALGSFLSFQCPVLPPSRLSWGQLASPSVPPVLPGWRSPPSSPPSAPPTPLLRTSLGSVCAHISISADCKDWFNFMGVISFKKSLSEQQPDECLIKHIFLR